MFFIMNGYIDYTIKSLLFHKKKKKSLINTFNLYIIKLYSFLIKYFYKN